MRAEEHIFIVAIFAVGCVAALISALLLAVVIISRNEIIRITKEVAKLNDQIHQMDGELEQYVSLANSLKHSLSAFQYNIEAIQKRRNRALAAVEELEDPLDIYVRTLRILVTWVCEEAGTHYALQGEYEITDSTIDSTIERLSIGLVVGIGFIMGSSVSVFSMLANL